MAGGMASFMKQIKLNINGESINICYQKINRELWIHYNGRTFSWLPKEKMIRHHSRQSTHPNEVRAPMPGKICKITVKKDDQVHLHQPLIVMEAMKMEYTLRAMVDGKIEKLEIREGDQVGRGMLLVKIKE